VFNDKVYFPFNYSGHPLISTMTTPYGNAGFLGTLPGSKLKSGGTITPYPMNSAPSIDIKLGIASMPNQEERFSGFRKAAGFQVPSTMELSNFMQYMKGRRVLSKLIRKAVYVIKDSGVVYPPNPDFDFHHYLEKGMLVSYTGEGGDVGVMYDPAKGSFEAQLKPAQKIKTLHEAEVGAGERSATKRWPWIPTILAGFFGLAAIVGLIIKMRRP
jgi:hypothetical protein